jgi:small conductance mechanosensitive channel
MMNLEQTLLTTFLLFIPRAIVAAVVMALSFFLAGVVSRLVSEALSRRGVNREFTQFFCELSRWSIIILGVIVALQQVNFDVTAFLTGLGIVGFTIGFALQDVSKNFVAGLLLLLQQPFAVGETIQVAGFTGKVAAISMRATELETPEGQTVLIPNTTVFTSPIIKNLTGMRLASRETQNAGN